MDTPTQITSHLLAALNLPPLRDVQGPYHESDRPLPLEPSAQDVYSARRPVAPPDQQSSQDDGHQNGGNMEDAPAPLTSAYPPIITPPQAADPSRQHHMQQAHQPHNPHTPATPAATKRSQQSKSNKSNSTARRTRRKWTEQETNDLILGCREHGVGNWKKVLDDPKYNFNGRSSVDLKDRFRTCFPKEYRKDAMNADDTEEGDATQGTPSKTGGSKRKVTKTELYHAEVLQQLNIDGPFPKVQRRERREFTAEEDARLLQGFTIYGASWSRIQNDPALHLGHRRSTDLRDRFRNAFPERYESAGFKARPRHSKSRQSGTPEDESSNQDEDEDAEGESVTQVDPAMEEASKADSTAYIVQTLLNEHLAANWVDPEGAAPHDAAPAPGSLALDPALHAGFEGSALEQLTSDLLAATQDKEPQRNGDMVRWEDMATHPIFEVEASFTMPSRGEPNKSTATVKTKVSPRLHAASSPRKRLSEPHDTKADVKAKRQRVEVQAN